jgi:hypothetical protein
MGYLTVTYFSSWRKTVLLPSPVHVGALHVGNFELACLIYALTDSQVN